MTDILTVRSDKKVIILLEDVDLLALHALSYATGLSKDIVAFSAITRGDDEEELRAKWDKLNSGIPYIIQFSQNKNYGKLLLDFIDSLESESEDVVVLVPLVIIKSWWQGYLNNSYLKRLKRSLYGRDNIVLIIAPYYLDQTD